MAWMTQQKQKGKPFFTYMALNVAHLPFWPPKKYANLYKEKAGETLAQYYGMIAGLDDNIGQMDEWLKKSGMYHDTIVVFMSDNGSAFAGGAFFVDTAKPAYNAGLRDGKASNYEGGHRTVCYLRYPGGGFDADRNIDTPTQIQDVLPTLLDLCDVSPGKAAFDGVSLVPLMKKQQIKDRMFVVQYGARQRPVKYDAAVIWKQWRLQEGKELYDIIKDRAQKTDVAAQFPEVAGRMKAFYEQWWEKLDPALNVPIPVIIGTPVQNPVLLTSIDWWEVDCDNINFVSQAVGGPRGGAWSVQVESAGNYRVELRRWPFHTNKPIGSEGPRATITGRVLDHRYKLVPAYEAVFSANGAEQRLAVKPENIGAAFQVNLSKGKSKLQGWFCGAKGEDLCGAYYALVTKLPG
jgi:hypothetical protein